MMKYSLPSKNWLEGLPLGNGRLAAMAWQNKDYDILTLNHEWLWRGKNRNRQPEKMAEYLPLVRKFLNEGDYFRATGLANLFFSGKGGCSWLPNNNDAYQVAGDLKFRLKGEHEFVTRELDVFNAMAKTVRRSDKAIITATFFASCISDLLLFQWKSDGEPISGEFFFDRVIDNDASYSYLIDDNKIFFTCQFNGGLKYSVVSKVITDGITQNADKGLIIKDATYINVECNIGTQIKGIDKELVDKDIDFENELKEHSKKFSQIMNRVEFDIEDGDDNCFTNEFIGFAREGNIDNILYKQLFDFGRYLLVSSSVCGELPANLQGKWNDSISPPWESDYHMDINLQMNYWFAESCNLPELSEKLIRFIKSFEQSGNTAARNLYGCRGILMPLQTDAWGISTPEAYGWAACLCAAPWLAQHLWWRYIYSGDKEYLKKTAYPFFKQVALFYEDYLVEDEDGILQIMPSQSPENRFEGTGVFPVSIGISSAMDVQLAYDALGYAIKSAEILDIDADERSKWIGMQNALPDFLIGKDGRLLEWNEEKIEVEPGHRHFAHLYGLHPSELFTREKRPLHYEACKKSLEYRLQHGAASEGGWINAWAACFFARLENKEGFIKHLSKIISEFMTVTLLDLYPPDIFQIDGNFGAVAAIVEAIVSYTDNKARILSAVPDKWKKGFLKGIKIPGGHTLSVYWKNGKVETLEIVFGFEESVTIVINGQCKTFKGKQGEKLVV